MAFDVGAIVARLTLDNKQWNAAVEKVEKQQSQLTQSIRKNSAQIKQFGRAMTVAGAAIVTGFGLMTKRAIDANETFSKFGVVFQDVIGNANKEVKALTESYGLSSVEATKLLSDTGDILTGFGFTGEAALDLSQKVNKLAVDLASFTNIEGGAEKASNALTAAMVGETERAKALGIVIRQDSKEFIGLVEHYQKSENMTLLQAKAMASLTIATKQSKNAIGDFARTQDSAANQARILSARFQDLIVDIGQKLVPVTQSLLTAAQKVVTRISEWVKENPKLASTIIKITVGIGALMAALGPLVIMLPNIVAGFGLIKTAVLATNPVLLGVTAVVIGLTAAISAFSKAQMKAMAAIKKSNDAQVSAIQTLRDYKKVADKEDQEFIRNSIRRLVEEGRTRTEATLLVAQELKNRSKAFRAFSTERNKIQKETVKDDKSNLDLMNVNFNTSATERKKITAGLFTEMTKMRNAFFAAALEAQQEFDAMNLELTNEREILNTEELKRNLVREQQEYEAKRQNIIKNIQDETSRATLLKSLHDNHLIRKAQLEDEYREAKNKKDEEDDRVAAERRKKTQQSIIDGIMTITSIFQSAAQARMNAIDQEFEERKAWIEENITDETEREKALEALEDEFSKKKKEAARKSAIADKNAALMGAIVNTAQAVTKAYAQGGILGFVTAAIMAAAGAVQIAAIKSQPIPLAQGGITTGETPAMIGDNPSGTEAVIPLERFDEIFGEQGTTVHININAIDGASVQGIFPQLKELIQNATKTENLLIAPNAVRSF